MVTGAAALALYVLPRHLASVTWLVPAVLLYAPLGAVFITDRDFDGCGLRRPSRGWGRDLAVFAFGVMPVFLVGFFFLATAWSGRDFHPRLFGPDAAIDLVWQLLGIALPEEVFFRGWMQGRLNRLFPGRVRLLGARVGFGMFAAAAVFAAFHLLATPVASRLLVFFPGLLFGLFRERTGSIAVPVAAHALANFLFLAAQGWVG